MMNKTLASNPIYSLKGKTNKKATIKMQLEMNRAPRSQTQKAGAERGVSKGMNKCGCYSRCTRRTRGGGESPSIMY